MCLDTVLASGFLYCFSILFRFCSTKSYQISFFWLSKHIFSCLTCPRQADILPCWPTQPGSDLIIKSKVLISSIQQSIVVSSDSFAYSSFLKLTSTYLFSSVIILICVSFNRTTIWFSMGGFTITVVSVSFTW